MSDLSPLLPNAACRSHAVHRPWPHRPAAVAQQTPSLPTWQHHHGSGAAALSPMPQNAVFDPSFLSQVQEALTLLAGRDVALVFVIAHHQPHYRSPVLPHLLSALPPFSSIYALRDSSGRMPGSALTLAGTVVNSGEACLLVHDLSRRLVSADAPETSTGTVHYTLFTPDSEKGSAE